MWRHRPFDVSLPLFQKHLELFLLDSHVFRLFFSFFTFVLLTAIIAHRLAIRADATVIEGEVGQRQPAGQGLRRIGELQPFVRAGVACCGPQATTQRTIGSGNVLNHDHTHRG